MEEKPMGQFVELNAGKMAGRDALLIATDASDFMKMALMEIPESFSGEVVIDCSEISGIGTIGVETLVALKELRGIQSPILLTGITIRMEELIGKLGLEMFFETKARPIEPLQPPPIGEISIGNPVNEG